MGSSSHQAYQVSYDEWSRFTVRTISRPVTIWVCLNMTIWPGLSFITSLYSSGPISFHISGVTAYNAETLGKLIYVLAVSFCV